MTRSKAAWGPHDSFNIYRCQSQFLAYRIRYGGTRHSSILVPADKFRKRQEVRSKARKLSVTKHLLSFSLTVARKAHLHEVLQINRHQVTIVRGVHGRDRGLMKCVPALMGNPLATSSHRASPTRPNPRSN